MKNIWKIIALIGIYAVSMNGCVTTGTVTGLAPVCEALGPPHEYNSRNKNSDWHAGKFVAHRLARDNQVGSGLHCKGY